MDRYRKEDGLKAQAVVREAITPFHEQVKEAIGSLASDPIPFGASRFRGRINAYRLRIGDYHVIHEVHVTEIVVYIVGVAHRREVYAGP